MGKGERTYKSVLGGSEDTSALDHLHLPCQPQAYGSLQVLSQMPHISCCLLCSLESYILQAPSEFCIFFMEPTYYELYKFVYMPPHLT